MKPNPNNKYPIQEYEREAYDKPTIKTPNNFTYIANPEFESHVINFYPWSRDKLIIGQFC